jgi:glycosyltransferase involved in cell wall biosynthesis
MQKDLPRSISYFDHKKVKRTTNLKKVSVAITVYNQAHYVGQAVSSALAQDYPNLEVIVSDNHSTDNIREVIDTFHDPRLKYFRNDENIGMLKNRHRALYNYSTGDYILHLDGDDYFIDSGYIRRAMDLIDCQGLAMVFARTKSLFEKDGVVIEDKINRNLPEVMDGNWFFLNFYKGYSLPTMTVVHDRRYAMEIGFFNKNICSADWEGFLRLMIGKKVGFVNQSVGVWRKHGMNNTLNQDLDKILSNVDYIDSPYRFALLRKAFPEKVLDLWRRRMLKRYFVQVLLKASITKDSAQERGIVDFLVKYDRTVYNSIRMDPRFIVMKMVIRSRKITYFIFKHVLKQETFIKDFEYLV